jgi:hypothetical protein
MRSAGRIAIVLCLLAAKAEARNIYVDNLAGDDKNSGTHTRGAGDATGPVRTIAKALRLSQEGDRVVLARNDVPYHESVSLVGARHGGSDPTIPFVLDGNGATLDGTSPVPNDQWTHYRDNIFCFRPKSLVKAVLFYRGRSIWPLPLPRGAELPPRLEPMQWCVLEGAIYFAVEHDKLPPDYKLSYAELPTGITLYQVRQAVVCNLTVQGFQADGVSATVGARDVVLRNVTCTGNGRRGVCVGGGAEVAVESCNLFGNGLAQLLTCASSETHLLSSTLSGDTAAGWIDQGGRVYLGSKRVSGGMKEIK